jgi:hypothetical protein
MALIATIEFADLTWEKYPRLSCNYRLESSSSVLQPGRGAISLDAEPTRFIYPRAANPQSHKAGKAAPYQ